MDAPYLFGSHKKTPLLLLLLWSPNMVSRWTFINLNTIWLRPKNIFFFLFISFLWFYGPFVDEVDECNSSENNSVFQIYWQTVFVCSTFIHSRENPCQVESSGAKPFHNFRHSLFSMNVLCDLRIQKAKMGCAMKPFKWIVIVFKRKSTVSPLFCSQAVVLARMTSEEKRVREWKINDQLQMLKC